MAAYLQGKEVFVQDCHVGAAPDYRLPIRVVSEFAWHSLFARNLFITPADGDLADHEPEFTIVQVPGFKALPETDGTNSEDRRAARLLPAVWCSSAAPPTPASARSQSSPS